MTQPGEPAQPPQPATPPFDPNAPHQQRPKLRPVRGFPYPANMPDGKQVVLLGLSDARQISPKIVVLAPAAGEILPHMDGTHDLDQIVQKVGKGLSRTIMEQLVAQLDDAGLIDGPNFRSMLKKMQDTFDASTLLPPAGTADFGDQLYQQAPEEGASDERKGEIIREQYKKWFDQWIDAALKDAPDPAVTDLPLAIVAPHLDYPRGWINYAAAYGRLRVADRPDRVIILGTNHFGEGTGVVVCDKGWTTPLGSCHADTGLIAAVRRRLGDKAFANRYDHEHEHSIELQIPWIQHVFGAGENGEYPKVLGALIHDPSVNNGESYDGEGVGLQAFVDAMREAIAEMPGRTLVISSADLSHAGPAFGDQTAMAGEEPRAIEARTKIFQHDREMLELLVQNKPSELVAAMAWMQNPTRWCSVGNLVAAVMITQPQTVRLLNYSAAMDEQGNTMVSSAAMMLE